MSNNVNQFHPLERRLPMGEGLILRPFALSNGGTLMTMTGHAIPGLDVVRQMPAAVGGYSVADRCRPGPERVSVGRESSFQREWNCLVVSSLATRREAWSQEAAAGGWTANRCGRMDAALRLARQQRVRLVIVELAGSSDEDFASLEELASHVARTGGLLLVACPAANGQAEEVRARQLGAWLYLAGEIPAGELASLCGDAKRLVDRTTSPGSWQSGRTSAGASLVS